MILKSIFYAILVYIAIRFVQRVFKVRRAVKEMRSRMENYERGEHHSKSDQEGEMTIKNTGKKDKRKFEEGEYVDYEDIE